MQQSFHQSLLDSFWQEYRRAYYEDICKAVEKVWVYHAATKANSVHMVSSMKPDPEPGGGGWKFRVQNGL